jgi:hypothetical protein
MLIINPPSGYRDDLGELPDGTELTETPEGAHDCDFVQLFVKNSIELHSSIKTAMDAVKPDGLVWICYPKVTSKIETDLNRDILASTVARFRLRGVSLVSINDVWSAMRFRPAVQ